VAKIELEFELLSHDEQEKSSDLMCDSGMLSKLAFELLEQDLTLSAMNKRRREIELRRRRHEDKQRNDAIRSLKNEGKSSGSIAKILKAQYPNITPAAVRGVLSHDKKRSAHVKRTPVRI
jgi:hypothetical protein